MRLTSTGLGIGTASPGYKLDVNTVGGAAATARLIGNDQSNVRLRLENSGSGGRTWELVGGLPGANNANFSIRDVTGSTTPLTIDSSGQLALGTTTATNTLTVQGTVAYNLNSTTDVYKYFTGGAGLVYAGTTTSTAIGFLTSGGERMRLDTSGNLGIGTSSPGQKLEVAGNIFVNTSGNPYAEIKTSGSGNNPYLKLTADTNSWTFQGTFSNANDDLLVLYNATTLLDLTKDGNLGLGVTPSAWGGTYKAQQIGQAGVLAGHGSLPAFTLASNAYENSGWKAITTNPAQRIDLSSDNNATIFYRAASATAGSALSWVETARFDSSGNLGIGTSSPDAKLRIDAASPTRGIVEVVRGTGSTGSLICVAQDAVADWAIGQPAGVNAFAFFSGRSPGADGTERARITSGGDLLVGTTSTSASSGEGFKVFANIGISGHFDPAVVTAANNASYSCWDIYSTATSSYRFYVTTTGVINAVNTTISAISDQRYKENICDLDVGLDAVLALKPRKFDWKTGKGKDIKNDRGFIAQEFEQVFPDLVDEWKDPAPEGEEPYKSVRQDLIPVLVKAIQELTARVAQLESK
jgi:hypothetical protein